MKIETYGQKIDDLISKIEEIYIDAALMRDYANEEEKNIGMTYGASFMMLISH